MGNCCKKDDSVSDDQQLMGYYKSIVMISQGPEATKPEKNIKIKYLSIPRTEK